MSLSRLACLLSALLALLLSACANAPGVVMPSGCTVPRVFATVPGYEPIYADRDKGGAFSQIDDANYAAMKGRMADFWGDLDRWHKMTNKVARDGDPAQARCAIAWLDTWAQGGHMLTPPGGTHGEQNQSRYEMKWALQSVATAYGLTLRDATDRGERRRIDNWLQDAADEVIDFNIRNASGGRLNNHYYWAGAAVMAVGVATDDDDLVQVAHTTYIAGIDQISPDGSLPRELERRQQALHYHAFALTPLTIMAELSRRYGDNWYKYKPERLPRLVDFVLHGVNDPAWAEQRIGVAQDRALMNPCSNDWGWTPFWLRYDAQRVSRLAPTPGQCSSRMLGGDIALLKARGLFAPPVETVSPDAP